MVHTRAQAKVARVLNRPPCLPLNHPPCLPQNHPLARASQAKAREVAGAVAGVVAGVEGATGKK